MKRSLRFFFRYWLPVAAWAWLIFYLSSVPSLDSGLAETADWAFRKIAHVVVYAVLTFFVFRALRHGHSTQIKTALLGAGVFALLYAFSDEFHQRFTPGRHGRLHDVAVDAAGIIGVVLL